MNIFTGLSNKPIDPSKLGVDEDLLDLFYEIGILGCVRSYFQNAAAIFEGYLAVKPKSERAMLGAGLLALSRPNYQAAIMILKDQLLKEHPNSVFGKAYLGIAYKQVNKIDEAKALFKEVISSHGDKAAVALAQAALDQLK